MVIIEYIKAIVIGIIQGITEWLPISSTGHMILADEFLKLNVSESFMRMFLVVIQFGSILAVVVLYFSRLNPFSIKRQREFVAKHEKATFFAKLWAFIKPETFAMWLKVLVGIIPVGVIGVLFEDTIDSLFYNPLTVAIMLIVYGILFIVIENRNAKRKAKINNIDELDYKTALFIGLFQVLSLIPGTSRSGATIVFALLLGVSRVTAAEFSFFMAVPTMLGASLVKMASYGVKQHNANLPLFSGQELGILIVAMVTAFIVSIFAIRFLMKFIQKRDFKPFGYYRIALGVIVIIYFMVKSFAIA